MNIKDDASLAMIPVAYKEDKLYSVIPNNDDGDFDFSRSSKGTRVNKGGFIEEMDNDIPRLDYPLLNGVVQDCPTILLEPQRTNLAQNSNELNTGWAHSNCNLTTNQVVAPDGSNTGSFVERTSTVQARVERGINVTDQNYTWSCFVKKGNQRYAFLNVYLNTSVVSVSTIFDFDTGSIVFSSSAVIANTVVEYPNGWHRLTTTFDALASQTAYIKVGSTSSTTVFSTGNVGDTIYVWGAQLEAGTYATSYIPTENNPSGVTRSADACKDSEPDFNDTEGVLYVNAKIDELNTDTNTISLGDGTFLSNSVEIAFQKTGGSPKIRGFCTIDGSTTSLIFTTIEDFSINHGLFHKVAYQYKQADFKMFVNGFKIGTSNYNDIFSSGYLQRLSFDGNGSGSTEFYGETKELMTFNQSMTDAEMEKLTSYESFKEMATEQLYTIE